MYKSNFIFLYLGEAETLYFVSSACLVIGSQSIKNNEIPLMGNSLFSKKFVSAISNFFFFFWLKINSFVHYRRHEFSMNYIYLDFLSYLRVMSGDGSCERVRCCSFEFTKRKITTHFLGKMLASTSKLLIQTKPLA